MLRCSVRNSWAYICVRSIVTTDPICCSFPWLDLHVFPRSFRFSNHARTLQSFCLFPVPVGLSKIVSVFSLFLGDYTCRLDPVEAVDEEKNIRLRQDDGESFYCSSLILSSYNVAFFFACSSNNTLSVRR